MKNTAWKLYLDDLRTPIDTSFAIARSVIEAQLMISWYGMPEFISFDHDLGCDREGSLLPDGYDFAKWLVEKDMEESPFKFPDNFDFKVHSQNPVGAQNIRSLLDGYFSHKRG